MTTDPVEDAYDSAKGQWTGMDWTERLGGTGEVYTHLSPRQLRIWADLVEHRVDVPPECPRTLGCEDHWAKKLREAADRLERAEEDAAMAEKWARIAILEYRKGNLTMASHYASLAAFLEDVWMAGDTWGPLRDRISRMLKDKDKYGWWAIVHSGWAMAPEAYSGNPPPKGPFLGKYLAKEALREWRTSLGPLGDTVVAAHNVRVAGPYSSRKLAEEADISEEPR